MRFLYSGAVLLAVMASGLGASARAEDEDRGAAMVAFFGGLEADWDGRGVQRSLDGNGRYVEERFDIELDVDRDWNNNTWRIDHEFDFERGSNENGSTKLHVIGGQLFSGEEPNLYPLGVSEATPGSLVYGFQRADVYGRVFHFAVSFIFDERGDLDGSITVKLNDVVVEERLYRARRW